MLAQIISLFAWTFILAFGVLSRESRRAWRVAAIALAGVMIAFSVLDLFNVSVYIGGLT